MTAMDATALRLRRPAAWRLRPLTALALTALLMVSACGGGGSSGNLFDGHLSAGRQAMDRNDLPAALIHLRNAVREKPSSGDAHYLLGMTLMRGGDEANAAGEFERAAQLGVPADKTAPPWARALLLQGNAKQVTLLFDQIRLQDDKAAADVLTSVAAAFEMQGDRAAAEKSLDAAQRRDAVHAPALLLRSRLAARDQQPAKALDLVEQALKADPTSSEGWRLKGDYLALNKAPVADAAAAYRKAIEQKKDDTRAHTHLIELLLSQPDADAAQAQLAQMAKVLPGHPATLRAEMLVAFQRKDFKRGREAAQRLLKGLPDDANVLQLAGAMEYEMQAFVLAEDLLSRALKVNPDLANARRMLADVFLRQGQGAKALEVLKPALAVPSPDPVLHAMAGEAYLQTGQIKEAEQAFKRSGQGSAGETRARTVLALSKIKQGAAAAGLDDLKSAAAADTGPTADVALIRTHLSRREFDQALAAITRLDRKLPDKAVAPNLRGLVLLARNDVAGARKSLEQALQREPDFYAAAATLSALDLKAKRPDLALARFDAMLARNPKDLRVLLAKAEVQEKSGATREVVAATLASALRIDPSAPAAHMALVDFHLRQGDVKQALAAGQAGVAANGSSVELLDTLGHLQLQTGDALQAVATYNRLVQLVPKAPFAHERLAMAQVAAKDPEKAEASMRKALELAPQHAAAQRGLVSVLLMRGNTSSALNVAATIQKQQPDRAIGYALEGDIHVGQKYWAQAIKAYTTGLAKADGADLSLRLHAALLASGDKAQADKFEAEWLGRHADDVGFRLHLAQTAILRNDLPQAERRYRDVLTRQPQQAQALNNLAWTLQQQKKPGARAMAEQAVALEPSNVSYLDTLAEVLEGEQQIAAAVAAQKKAVDLQPGNPMLRLRLAKLQVKAGDKELARRNLEQLSREKNPFPGQAEVAPLLKAI